MLLIQPFLLRLLAAFKILWSKEMESSVPIVIPSIRFFDGSINYYDMDRLGGVLLYLLKTYRNDVQQRLEVSQTTHMISNERNSPHQSFTESTSKFLHLYIHNLLLCLIPSCTIHIFQHPQCKIIPMSLLTCHPGFLIFLMTLQA